MSSHTSAERVFGALAARYLALVRDAVRDATRYEYVFLSQADFAHLMSTDVAAAMAVYWQEILYRAHFGSMTALMRFQSWADAILLAADGRNYLAFAASFRGLLESAADTCDAFQIVPLSLAEVHTVVRRAVAGSLTDVVVAQDLENALIHFTHARKLATGDVAPSSHRAKLARQYLNTLVEHGAEDVHDAYDVLCQLTHPASQSLMVFAQRSVDGRAYRIAGNGDSQLIADFLRRYPAMMIHLVALGVMPPLLTLRALNELGHSSVFTPVVSSMPLDDSPVWQDIVARLRDPQPPRFTSVLPSRSGTN